jgi:hypothetical protein
VCNHQGEANANGCFTAVSSNDAWPASTDAIDTHRTKILTTTTTTTIIATIIIITSTIILLRGGHATT